MRQWVRVLSVVLAGLLLPYLSAGPGFAQSSPPSPTAPHVPDEVIVKFRRGVHDYYKAYAHAGVAAIPIKIFETVEGLEVVKLPPGLSVKEAIERYRQNPDVHYSEPNYLVYALALPNDPQFGDLWGLHNTGQSGGTPGADIEAVGAWGLTTGSPDVVVVVIDTGIDYDHPDLVANMFQNEADCNTNGVDDDGNGFIDDCYGIDTYNNVSNPKDDHNHGTHVAGTIGAVGDNSVGVVGVNWTVKLMACKFLSAGGSGTIADAIDCLNYVKIMKDGGVPIIATNNSWGGGGFSQALQDAIDAHRQSGILFFAAAGNAAANNDTTNFYPANYYLPNLISVAATDRNDNKASFSNYGRRTVHLGAPGASILSTTKGNTYSTFSGTSMATPHVAGVAALLKAQDPTRDWRAIKNLILAGGENIPALANTITQKRLNALGALTCSNAVVRSRLRPIADSITGAIGTPIDLAALHINCANPNGSVSVTVNPGGQTVTLQDDGVGADKAAGDGIYSGRWTPSAGGTFTLTFPDSDVVTVTVPGSGGDQSDLIVSSASAPSSVKAGSTISVTDTTKNQVGGAAGPSTTKIYLSADATWDAGDVLLGSRAIPALAAGASSTGTTSVTIPAGTGPGTWYFIFKADADNQVPETNEGNNTKAASFTIAKPDLIVSSLSAPSSAAPGATITVSDTTKNQGSVPAGASTTKFYLSTNSTWDAGDVFLGSRAIPALNAYASRFGSTSVTIPAGTTPVTYYIIAKADADAAVVESSEVNNTKYRKITIKLATTARRR